MIDLRNKISLKGSRMILSLDTDYKNVEQLLMTIGINPTYQLINQIMDYINSNNFDLTMKNLYLFLKSKSIISNDHRRLKMANNKINIVHYTIMDFNNFNSKMIDKGYSEFTRDFLIKEINNITINITRNNEVVSAITAYDENHSIISIPNDVLSEVIKDIEECNM